MVCIYCGHDTKVTNSRPQIQDNSIWRRRECKNCHALITTQEKINLEQAIRVQKKNGELEPFYRDKLFLSIYLSVDHLKNARNTSTALTNTVLRRIYKVTSNGIIDSHKLTALTARTIKLYDAAAGIRYLSYKSPTQLPNDVRRLLKQ
jgi:transcriptional repressor NrdR